MKGKGITQSDIERIAAEKGLDITVSEPVRIEAVYMVEPEPQFKRSKHRNIKTEIDGITFDSKKEARRYLDLREQQRAGAISGLLTQFRYTICIKDKEETYQHICDYIADFTYQDRDGKVIVEDVKSSHTRKMDVYRIKKKLMKVVLGIDIVEIL